MKTVKRKLPRQASFAETLLTDLVREEVALRKQVSAGKVAAAELRRQQEKAAYMRIAITEFRAYIGDDSGDSGTTG